MTRGRPLPHWMRSSAAVDLAQLRAGVRPVMRSQFADRPDLAEVRQWVRRQGWYLAVDSHGFFAIGADAAAVRRTLRIDARPGRHMVALGRQLGYPLCCCLAAAPRLEEGLDAWAMSVSRRPFVGMFKLIRPAGYGAGKALISHVPCSARCRASLAMALQLDGGGPPKWRRGSSRFRGSSAARPGRR